MAYEVRIIKQSQVFIDEMETKLRARIYWVIGLLEDMGPFLGEPYSKKISDRKGLHELRVQSGNLGCRLFYFHSGDAVYVVTSGFMKKQQKTPRREIERAMKLMKQYQEENHGRA
ncbi:type II toxin-antitoxin system RelE/ParE family toxin [Treponema sp.]